MGFGEKVLSFFLSSFWILCAMAKATIGDKIVETLYSNRVTSENKRIHTPPLHSRLRCLLFSIGNSNSGTTLYGGDGGGKALFSPFEVRETSESPFTAIVSQLILSPILVPSTQCPSPSIPGHLSEICPFFLCKYPSLQPVDLYKYLSVELKKIWTNVPSRARGTKQQLCHFFENHKSANKVNDWMKQHETRKQPSA